MARPSAPAEGDVAAASGRTRPKGAPSSSTVSRAFSALGTTALCLALLGSGGATQAEVPSPQPAAVHPAPPLSGVLDRDTGSEDASTLLGPFEGNPFGEHAAWAPADSAAAQAAESQEGADAALLERLASVPTATWLLPEAEPLGVVGDRVRDVVRRAHHQGRVPVLVVYGIPGRDCVDGHSGGGLPADEYRDWVREIADAAGTGAVVVLEPDALASGDRCGPADDRVELLHQAVGTFADGPVTYVDAGHSRWLDAATVAARLRAVGVERVRGFSLNVANFNSESSERAYGERVVAALAGAAPDVHFVIDTGRAGAGANGEWCNPSGRALGAEPAAVLDGGPMDARLWVKPPGESDGTCNGGPDAGTFWTERALEMARAAGW